LNPRREERFKERELREEKRETTHLNYLVIDTGVQVSFQTGGTSLYIREIRKIGL
jgi:hypothetical protein